MDSFNSLIKFALIVVSFCSLKSDLYPQPKTMYYLPGAVYYVNKTGNVFNSPQTLFLGVVRATTCESTGFDPKGAIIGQFVDHIESNYRDKLGITISRGNRIAYWYWDSPGFLYDNSESLISMYPNVEYISTFFLDCSNSRTGYNNVLNYVDSGNFEDFGDPNSRWGKGQYGYNGIWWNSMNAKSYAKKVKLTANNRVGLPDNVSTALLITNSSSRAGHVYGTTVQEIQGKPNHDYKISLWAAADNTPSNNAVSIAVESSWVKRPIVLKGGSYGWTLYEGTFTTDETGVIQLRILAEDLCNVWLTGLTITDKTSELPNNSFYDIPLIKGRANQVNFYEGGFHLMTQDLRKYDQEFYKSNTRYIWWELSLDHNRPLEKLNFDIEAIYYGPDENKLGSVIHHTFIIPDWETSLHTKGWGWEQVGNWKPGTYTVEFLIEGKIVARGNFIIRTGEMN